MADMTYTDALPDPDHQAEFYADTVMKRFLAWIVDAIMIAVLTVLVLPFTAFTGIFFFPALMLVLGFIYRVTTLTGRSATWGMRLFAVEFRDRTGKRFDLATAFLHTAGYSISMAMAPLQLISIILMLVSSRKQGLTDHILGTVAVNGRALS